MRLTGAVVAKSVGLVRGLSSALALAVGFNAVFSLFGERSHTPALHGGWEPTRLPPLDAAGHASGAAGMRRRATDLPIGSATPGSASTGRRATDVPAGSSGTAASLRKDRIAV